MGTLSYILFSYIHYIETLSKPNSHHLHRTRSSPRRKEGKPTVPPRGGQEAVGLHQGEQTPGQGQQAVLPPRQSHAAHLWNRKGQSFRYGQAPQGTSHQLNHGFYTSSQNYGRHGFCGDYLIQWILAPFI